LYQIGQLIIYGGEGVCRVDHIGPLEMRGAQKGVKYYTLIPLYRMGKVFAPVDTTVHTRPILTRDEVESLIDRIPQLDEEIYENSNPRLLAEHYQTYLKSYDCEALLRLIRSIHTKSLKAADKGRHLGQVDERSMKRAEEMLHGEIAAALGIPVEDVPGYITRRVEGARPANG